MLKAKAAYTAAGRLFLTARWARVSSEFELTPQGGLDVNMIASDDSGIARNSFYQYRTERPQQSAAIEGSYFRGRHEVRAGIQYRRAGIDDTYTVPGNAIITYHHGYPAMIAEVTAWNQVTGAAARYAAVFAGDTLSLDRWTLNAGLRWDRQAASVNAYSQAGNPALSSLLPDLTGRKADEAIVWSALTPRLAASYSPGEARSTLVRASYAALPSQMGADTAGFLSVASFRGVYFFDVFDQNLNGTVDREEIAGRTCSPAQADSGACGWYGFDLANPASTDPNHRIGSYRTPITHELTAGVDHELLPNLGISATVTWRRFVHFTWSPIEGLGGEDYEPRGTYSGTLDPVGPFSVPFYGVRADRIPANRTRTEYTTREDYHQRFLGFEMSATRRLSNRWMARAAFSTNDHREYFESPLAFLDPTPTPGAPNIDGGHVMRETAGSGKTGIFMMLPKYQLSAAGVYQARWGIDLAANLLVRQGFAAPYYRSRVLTGDPLGDLKSVLLAPPGRFRLAPVTSLDARAAKRFTRGRVRFTVDVDLFNVLNAATVLRRQYDLRVPTANIPLEVMAPRILRLGVRIAF